MKKQKPDESEFGDAALELYFYLCTRMYERMEKEGFPWEKDES